VAASLLGTVLIVAAANALNMFYERDVDGFMERTRRRPLVEGRLSPEVAVAVGTGTAALAVPLLFLGANLLTGILGLLAFVSYVWMYTPLKRRSSSALFVGAVPGALPPLMGWTVATGRIDAGGLALFAVLFLWQIPHFLAIALYRAQDYARAGIRVLPATQGERAARVHILVWSVALVGSTLLLWPLGVAHGLYLVVAVVLGALFIAWAAAGFCTATPRPWAKSLFLYSILYLTLLFVALAVDHQILG
jgi:heme o synthase